MANGLWRALVVLHRYLGVAVGFLMAVWFVSGIVMMYVGFPRLTESERLRALRLHSLASLLPVRRPASA